MKKSKGRSCRSKCVYRECGNQAKRTIPKKKSWNSLMRYRYRFTQFKKRQSEKFNSIANRILLDLTDLEKAFNES